MTNTAAEPEVVATRTTADGATVRFHADGQVSFRTHFERGRLPASMIWRVAGDVCLYNAIEVPGLLRDVKAGRWRPFRVLVVRPVPATAVYRGIKCANGMEVLVRVR